MLLLKLEEVGVFPNSQKINFFKINPLASLGEVVSVFISPYLSAGAPSFGEAKGLIFI